MKKEIKVEDKNVTVYYDENINIPVPIVILNTFDEDGENIWNLCKEKNCRDYILATISNINWNDEMSPWYMKKLYKNDKDYLGKADEYIEKLTNRIIPEIEKNFTVSYYVLAGYSLAGLFSIYSMYKTEKFKRIVSASGSFWYPNFLEYINKNKIKNNPDKIYFSLGNKESKTKNELMSKVEVNTKYLLEYYKNQGIETIYEENEGNHFQDVNIRIAKGICNILEDNNLERIKKNEERLDRIILVLNKQKVTDEDMKIIKNDYEEINRYYGSKEWFQDLEDHDNGKIKIKAGVLSQDGIWNMIEKYNEIIKELNIRK